MQDCFRKASINSRRLGVCPPDDVNHTCRQHSSNVFPQMTTCPHCKLSVSCMSVRAETRKYVFSIKSTNAKTRVAFVLVMYYICMSIVCVYISLCVINSRQEHNLSSNSYDNKQGRNCFFKALIRYKRVQYGSYSLNNAV